MLWQQGANNDVTLPRTHPHATPPAAWRGGHGDAGARRVRWGEHGNSTPDGGTAVGRLNSTNGCCLGGGQRVGLQRRHGDAARREHGPGFPAASASAASAAPSAAGATPTSAAATPATAATPTLGAGTFPATVTHKYGTTQIKQAPKRVLSLGFNDQDSLLALDVVPVGILRWFATQPRAVGPWAEPKLGSAQPAIIGWANSTTRRW